MFVIISIVILGIVAGRALRRSVVLKRMDAVMSWTVSLMLFMLGLSVGSNPLIISNIGSFGGQALLICCAGIVGSVLFVVLFGRLFFRKGGRQ